MCFCLILLSTYISYKVDKSYIEQTTIINLFNRYEWRKEVWGDKINFQTDFPNISATGLPLKSIKANYIRENDGLKKSIDYIKNIESPNPFLGYEEGFLANAYGYLNNPDSAYYYGKIAYNKLPLNTMFTVNYMYSIAELKKYDELQNIFNKIKSRRNIYEWKMYLFYLEKEKFLHIDSIKNIFNQAYKNFPDETLFDSTNRMLQTNLNTLEQANIFAQKGEDYIKEKKYIAALKEFSKASELVPEEYAYHENIVLINFLLKYHNKVIKQVDSLFSTDIVIPNNGKLYFYRAVSHFETNNEEEGCTYLLKSIEDGYEIAKNAIFLRNKCGF